MIESFDFLDVVNKSNENKKPNTTSNNLKLFFSQSSKFHSSDSYSTKDEDDYDINIGNDFLDIADYSGIENLNPTLPLKEEVETEENFSLYFNSVKENNQNSSFLGQKRKLFKINYRKKYDESNEIYPSSVEKAFLNNKVLPTIKRRRENQDNIRKKLKTVFFNTFLRKKINEILNNKHSRLYFEKFPISFVNDIRKNTNKDVIDKTLLEIILNKELYSENDLSNYNHNLKVVENKEVKKIGELKKILNKTFRELFEEFINSKEFNIDEINRLRNNNLDNIYIERYIYQSKHFIEYFAE
jgi:hypothetical protein